jgi:hypothetical protein
MGQGDDRSSPQDPGRLPPLPRDNTSRPRSCSHTSPIRQPVNISIDGTRGTGHATIIRRLVLVAFERGIWFYTASLIVRIGALLLAARIALAVCLGYISNGNLFVGPMILALGMTGSISDDRAFYAWWYALWGVYTLVDLVALAGSAALGYAGWRGTSQTLAKLCQVLRS